MRELNPQDSELIRWAEIHSNTVSIKVWATHKQWKEILVLIKAQSLAEVINWPVGLLDHVRLAILEQYFIEGEEKRDG